MDSSAAVQILAGYADTVATQVEMQLLRTSVKPLFFRSVGFWLFSAVVFAIAASGLIILLSRSGVDLLAIWKQLARPPS